MQYVIQNKENNRRKQKKTKKKRFLDKFNKINKPKETLIQINNTNCQYQENYHRSSRQ